VPGAYYSVRERKAIPQDGAHASLPAPQLIADVSKSEWNAVP